MATETTTKRTDVLVKSNEVELEGNLAIPEKARGIVVFAHGSGSSRLSPRNQFVSETLNDAGLATLLFDLLTAEENRIDEQTRKLRFDMPLLENRLTGAVDWVSRQAETGDLPMGLFGASTGAAAALMTAAKRPEVVQTVVSRGGRPDLAEDALPQVRCPTLLIVGGYDLHVLKLNQHAAGQMAAESKIEIVAEASHLFEEPGKLEIVARLASEWFCDKLTRP